MFVFSALEGCAGVAIVGVTLNDVFQAVLVPRASAIWLRPSTLLSRTTWALWKRCSWCLREEHVRDDALALFAPMLLILLLAFWVVNLMVGFGLCFYAIRHHIHPVPSLGAAMYFSGTTLLTLGFGDYVGRTTLARFLVLCTAASGLATIAVVTAFLFAIFAAFQRREMFTVMLGYAAGAPPSGLFLLEMYASLQIRSDLPDLFQRTQAWAAEILESHLAYPILMYFRSSHNSDSWVATLGATLDAAVLMKTTIADAECGQATLYAELGAHVTNDINHFLQFSVEKYVGIEYSEFLEARTRLAAAGYALHEVDIAWPLFCQMRKRYAGGLNVLARYLAIAPAQWIGDRSYLPLEHPGARRKQQRRS